MASGCYSCPLIKRATPCASTICSKCGWFIALNKQSRLQRVFISSSASDPALVKMQQDFPDLVVAGTANMAWRNTLTSAGRQFTPSIRSATIMMRYANPADMRGVLKDLERLLKYSWIR